ncbi:MAG: class II fructose-bisphosphate aldolase family protein [Clostridiales bacterium]|nr:class II fructose-bisphosphate aldolase family protein [Clostridiales bacterium]
MNLQKVYANALKNKFALGAFNFVNMESLKGILDAAQEQNTPVICAVSESAFEYMGFEFLKNLITSARNTYTVPFFIHLDHGKSLEFCKKAINCGFDSVMIDGSHLPLEQNIALTKSVCDYAHKFGVQVEGELGKLKGVEDNISSDEQLFTDPIEAKQFVEQTKVDSLAIAIGTSHGVNKFSGEAKIRIDILEEIEKVLPNTPLVLHGASSVPQNILAKLIELGADLKKAKGVPEEILTEVSTKHNVVKINVDSDLRMATTLAVRKYLKENPKEIDVRKYLGQAKKDISNLVKNKIINVFKTKEIK